jgi:hypothetical protein
MKSKSTTKPAINKKIAVAPEKNLDDLALLDTESAKLKHKKVADQLLAEASSNNAHLAHAAGQPPKVVATSDQVDTEALADGDENYTISKSDLDFMANQWESGQGNFFGGLQSNTVETASLSSDAKFSKYLAPVAAGVAGVAGVAVGIAASGNDDNTNDNDNDNDNDNTPINCDHTLPDNTRLQAFLATAGAGEYVQVDASRDADILIQGGFQRSATGSAATALYDIADLNLGNLDTDFLSDLEGQLGSDGLHIELLSDSEDLSSEDASRAYVGAYSMALGDNTSDIIWLKDLTITSDESADKAWEYKGRIEIAASASGDHADAETAVGNVAIHLGNAESESEARFYQRAYVGSGDSSAHTYVGDVEISASADEYRAYVSVDNYAEAYGDCAIAVSEFGSLTLNATHLNSASNLLTRYGESFVNLQAQAESEGSESYLLGGDVSAHVLATGALAADRDENYNFYGRNFSNIESSADGVSANAVVDIGNVSLTIEASRTDIDLVGVYADVDNRVGSRVGYLAAYAFEPGASASTTLKDLTLSASYDHSMGEIGGGMSTRSISFSDSGPIYEDDKFDSYVSAYALISNIRAIAESKDSTASITLGNVDLDATQSLSLAGMYNDNNDATAYIENYAVAGISQLFEDEGDISGFYIAAYGVNSAADLTMTSLTINADTNLLIEGDITENSILTAYNNSYAHIQYLASYLSGEGVTTQIELADVSLTATSNMSAVGLTDDGNMTLLGDVEDESDVTSLTYADAYLGYLNTFVMNGSDNEATTTLGDLSLAANASNNFGVINSAILDADVEAKATVNEIYVEVYGNDNTASLTLDSLDLDAHASFTVVSIDGDESLNDVGMRSYAWAYSDFIEAYARGTNDSATVSIDGVIDIASSATFLNDGDIRDSHSFIYTEAYGTLGEVTAEVYGNDMTATFKAGSVSVTAMSSLDAQNYYDGYAYSRSYSRAYARGMEAKTSEGSNNVATFSIDGLNVSADTTINMGLADSMSMQTAGYSEAYVGYIVAYAWGESSNTALLTINGDLVVNATTIVNLSGDEGGVSVIDSFEGGEAPHFTQGAYSEAYFFGVNASADEVGSLVELSIVGNIDITADSTLTAGHVSGESEVDYIVGAYAHMSDLKINSYDDATAHLTVLDVNVEALSSVAIGDISNGNVDPSIVKIGTYTSALINYMSAYSRQGGETSFDVGNISVTASNSVLFGTVPVDDNASFDPLYDPTADVLFNNFDAENQVEAIIHHMYAYAYTDASTTYTAGDITISATGLYGSSYASLNDMRTGAHADGTSFMSVGNINITASNEEEAVAQLDYLYAYAYIDPNPFGISHTSSATLETRNITIAATSQVDYAEARLEIRSEGQNEGAVATALFDGNISLSAISLSGDAQASLDIGAFGNDDAIASVEVTGDISLSVDAKLDYAGFDVELGISTYSSGDSVTVGDITLSTEGDASSTIRLGINSVANVNNIVIGNVDVSMEDDTSIGNIDIAGVAWDMDRLLSVSGAGDILVNLGYDQTGDDATQVFGTINLGPGEGNVSITFANAEKDVILTTQTGAAIATAGIDFTVIEGFDGDLNTISFDGIDQVGNIDWGNESTETAVADLWSDLLLTLDDTNEYAFTVFEETGTIDLDGDGTLLETMGVLVFDSNAVGISNIVFIDNEPGPDQYSISPLI